MYNNGVSHKTEARDLDGIYRILKWLSYIPKSKESPLPVIKSVDPVERDIDYVPTKVPYDPRWMIAGKENTSLFCLYYRNLYFTYLKLFN